MKYKIFEADKDKGYNFSFILFTPDRVESGAKIFVEGANSEDYEKDGQQSYDAQVKFAENETKKLMIEQDGGKFNRAYLYQQLNCPVVIPIIERCDNDYQGEFYTQMLGKNVVKQKFGKFANLSKQVVNMVNFVKGEYQKKCVVMQEKNGLLGFSASGVFASRMMFAEPESFDTCISICSNAVQPLPVNKITKKHFLSKEEISLPYPLGTADYEELFGKKFDIDAYSNAKQLYIVGKDEPNSDYDIAKKDRLHDKETQDLYMRVYGDCGIQDRQNKIASFMQNRGFDNVSCLVSEGGHALDGKGRDIIDFVNSVMIREQELGE